MYTVTQHLQHEQCHIRNVLSILVDTPGYKDTKGRNDEHFNNLESYLYGCGGVDAFLLVMIGTNDRFDENTQEMLKYYKEYFGCKFWDHLVMILTYIEEVMKEKFIRKNKGQTLQSNLKKHFGLNFNIPIVTIGPDQNENYDTFCKEVMDKVIAISNKHSKLLCERITSPI